MRVSVGPLEGDLIDFDLILISLMLGSVSSTTHCDLSSRTGRRAAARLQWHLYLRADVDGSGASDGVWPYAFAQCY
jgi:hypothetical protein